MYRCIVFSLFLLLSLSTELVAQASIRVAAFTGPAWAVSESDDDGSGWSRGVGLTFGYEVNERWGTLQVSVSRESFSGFHVARGFSQRVRQLAPSQVRTAVSVAVHQRGFQAYRILLGGENVLNFLPSRLQWGAGLGVLIIPNQDQVQYEVIEQDLQGTYLPPSPEYGFVVEDGFIQRVASEDTDSRRRVSPLKRITASLQTSVRYQLTDDVQLSLTWDCAISPLGKKYGDADGQTMFGELNYLQLGVVGRVFSW